MEQIKVILPAMGEGIFEATITQWLVSEGDTVNEDDSLVEIATDKVDSEVPSPTTGIIDKILIASGEVVKIGQEIAIITTKNRSADNTKNEQPKTKKSDKPEYSLIKENPVITDAATQNPQIPFKLPNGKFLSPLVRSIANKEEINIYELEQINGTGKGGRVTKEDIFSYIKSNNTNSSPTTETKEPHNDNIEIIEMDRMRKLIAGHMVHSKQTAPHVTTFHEVDVTEIVKWREKNKNEFLSRYGQKLTYTPIFIDAAVKAIKKFPMVNISVDGDNILLKKMVNIGMATALPNGNLIVPVIHNADELSLSALSAKVNDLANRARTKKLQPNEIQGGTFTITNVGTFGNLSGTPIINQPEVAILAVGAIKKRAAVIETAAGDFIGIRHQMVLALSYDHRVVDGSLGGMFLKQIADNMENFDGSQWL